MSDPKNDSNKDQTQEINTAPASSTKAQGESDDNSISGAGDDVEADVAELSADDLEQLIRKEDPKFAQSLNQISSVDLTAEGELDLVNIDEALSEEPQKNNKLKGFKALKGTLKTFFKKIKNHLIIFITGLKTSLEYFFFQSLPYFFKKIIEIFKELLSLTKEKYKDFNSLSIKLRLMSIFLTLAAVGTTYYIFLVLKKGGLIHYSDKLFITSFKELAQATTYYDTKDKTQVESFYDSTRTIQHIIVLQKNVVNIRPSENSSPNPMFAFELFIKGNTSEVILEIKDREYEVKDRVQRLVETMSFAQLDTLEGKQLLLEKLRKELNDFLTKGRIRRVYFKTLILKP